MVNFLTFDLLIKIVILHALLAVILRNYYETESLSVHFQVNFGKIWVGRSGWVNSLV